MSDFLIVKNGEAIKCMACDSVSHHPMDIKYKYCGKCKRFIDSDRLGWTDLEPEYIHGMGRNRFTQYMQQEVKDNAAKHLDKFSKEMLKIHQEHAERSAEIDRNFRNRMIACGVLILVVVLLTVFEALLRMGVIG